jgi:hypothetical protein
MNSKNKKINGAFFTSSASSRTSSEGLGWLLPTRCPKTRQHQRQDASVSLWNLHQFLLKKSFFLLWQKFYNHKQFKARRNLT